MIEIINPGRSAAKAKDRLLPHPSPQRSPPSLNPGHPPPPPPPPLTLQSLPRLPGSPMPPPQARRRSSTPARRRTTSSCRPTRMASTPCAVIQIPPIGMAPSLSLCLSSFLFRLPSFSFSFSLLASRFLSLCFSLSHSLSFSFSLSLPSLINTSRKSIA